MSDDTKFPDRTHFEANLVKTLAAFEGQTATPEVLAAVKAATEAYAREHELALKIGALSADIHDIHVKKQFYEEPRTVSHLMGLVMTELAEVVEDDRKRENGAPSEKIPGFTKEEEETADAIIRLLDFAGYRKLRIGAAILAKHEYNKSRPPKHGKRY